MRETAQRGAEGLGEGDNPVTHPCSSRTRDKSCGSWEAAFKGELEAEMSTLSPYSQQRRFPKAGGVGRV